MNQGTQPETARRTKSACVRCRQRKVKCSGTHPCSHCARKQMACRFTDEDNRVSVSSRYLRELERRYGDAVTSSAQVAGTDAQTPNVGPSTSVNSNQSPTTHVYFENAEPSERGNCQARDYSFQQTQSRGTSRAEPTTPNVHEHIRDHIHTPPEFAQNPLIAKHSFVRDANGDFHFLGPTSTWSFSRRVLALVEKQLPPLDAQSDPLNLDGAAYTLEWDRHPNHEAPDVSGLPSLDYALFLFNAVKFNLGQLFRIIDDDLFLQELNSFYENASAKASQSRLWYAQYLLVLAFGKNFLVHYKAGSAPPGSGYAARALSLLPEIREMYGERILEIEVLCLAALYLQCMDFRITAFQYIGQALRLCFVEGIHRDFPVDVMGERLSHRCSNVWWTVFILDQEFSALMGAPSSIHYNDISMVLPSAKDHSTRAATLTLQVHLSQLTARIMSTVYSVGDNLDGSFLTETQCVLHSLADLSLELDNVVKTRFEDSVGSLSRVSTHITLSYHHCIVLATRPLVMCMLQRGLQPARRDLERRDMLPAPIVALLQTCVESAISTVKIIIALKEQDLLDCFLPFHLENVFCAAFVLCIIRATASHLAQNPGWHPSVLEVLDTMISRGSATARLRRDELVRLEMLLSTLMGNKAPRTDPQEGQENIHTEAVDNAGDIAGAGDARDVSQWPPFYSSTMSDGLNMTNVHMWELAEQLGPDEFSGPFVFDDSHGDCSGNT